jgi:hypothetical protein
MIPAIGNIRYCHCVIIYRNAGRNKNTEIEIKKYRSPQLGIIVNIFREACTSNNDIKNPIITQSRRKNPTHVVSFFVVNFDIRIGLSIIHRYLRIPNICPSIINHHRISVNIVSTPMLPIKIGIDSCPRNNSSMAIYLISPDPKNPFSL